jgi:two-component system cell cycle sensor histidine kinase/response regulator CckA
MKTMGKYQEQCKSDHLLPREEKNRWLIRSARALLNATTDSVFLIDRSGKVLALNEMAAKRLGKGVDEILGACLYDFLPPELAKRRKRYFDEAFDTARPSHFEDERQGLHFDVCASPISDASGRVTKLAIYARDITERKRFEQALFESEQRYRNLVENAPDVIFTLAADGTIASLNPGFERTTGWSRSERLNMHFTSMLHPDDLSRGLEFFQHAMKGKKIPPFELRILKKSGDYVAAEFTATSQIQSGSVTGILGIARDITERKRTAEEKAALQEQLRQSQKMEAIGRLAGGVAHDFNNLLTVIRGYSQISLEEIGRDHPLRENIEEIRIATDRAADLTRQLLAFSRRQVMEMEVLDLNACLQNLDRMLRRVIGEDIELVTFLERDLGWVRADPGQMEQVIMNLAVNARDAMPHGGKLTIETGNVELDQAYARTHIAVMPGRYVMVSVTDTGVGMTPEIRDRVFEPFFTTKAKGKGTGLGLSTVYGIIKQSGGNIWVYSEPGRGATLKIYLPCVPESSEKSRERPIPRDLSRGDETILIVEDEEVVLKLAGRILRKQGYEVWEASRGEEALKMCQERSKPFHLLLTDVVMPQMGGRELADRLKEAGHDFKVLYMSGYTDNAITHHGILDKGVNYLQKPFAMQSLLRKVREALDK